MAIPAPLRKSADESVKRTTLSEAAHQAIRADIITGVLAPGSKLVVSTLADTLRLSATPINEALAGLEREGLVTCFPHRGYFVRTVIPEDIEKTYSVREAFETARRPQRREKRRQDRHPSTQGNPSASPAVAAGKTTPPDSATSTWSFIASSGTVSIIRWRPGSANSSACTSACWWQQRLALPDASAAPSRNTTRFTRLSGPAIRRGLKAR